MRAACRCEIFVCKRDDPQACERSFAPGSRDSDGKRRRAAAIDAAQISFRSRAQARGMTKTSDDKGRWHLSAGGRKMRAARILQRERILAPLRFVAICARGCNEECRLAAAAAAHSRL